LRPECTSKGSDRSWATSSNTQDSNTAGPESGRHNERHHLREFDRTGTGNFSTAYTWNQYTSNGQWLEFGGDNGSYHGGNVRYIQIYFTVSPARISAREIEIYGSVEYFGYFYDAQINGSNYMSETVASGVNFTNITAFSVADLSAGLA